MNMVRETPLWSPPVRLAAARVISTNTMHEAQCGHARLASTSIRRTTIFGKITTALLGLLQSCSVKGLRELHHHCHLCSVIKVRDLRRCLSFEAKMCCLGWSHLVLYMHDVILAINVLFSD